MMKTMSIAVLLFLAGSAATFAQKQEVKEDASLVHWTGKKIGGSHEGEIQVKSGYFDFKDGRITGGKVVMDMNTITNTDLKDGGTNQKLVGHLKSDDFFGVEKYPTSSFEVTDASNFSNGKARVSGKLTIKNKTEKISFDVIKKGNEYTAEVEVDRSKFDVRYGSNSFFDNLGDNAINDMFTLEIKLVL